MVTTKTSGSGAVKFRREPRKSANLSRKQVFEVRQKLWKAKKEKLDAEKQAAKRARVEQLQKAQHKKANKAFDRTTLHAVQDGLTAAIEALGESVTPLALFMGAFTALSKSPEKHQVPYLLAILSACVPNLSQGVVLHQMGPTFTLCEQLIAENTGTNQLIVTKAMKLAQTMQLAVEHPTLASLRFFQRLEPSKLNADAMKMYLGSFRKILEQAALSTGDPTSPAPTKDVQTGTYALNASQRFFTEAVPLFASTCLSIFTDAPTAVATAAAEEFAQLLQRSLSPYVVESREGQRMIDDLLSGPLLSMLKPVLQPYWGVAMELLEGCFNRINYVKRVAHNTVRFTDRFPSAVFLLRVLNKLRVMDDGKLNGKIERAMVALAKGMTVREFVDILPFDPRAAAEAELQGDESSEALWSTSYTLNVIRRAASHDSLPFFTEYFFPFIQYASRAAMEAEHAQRLDEFNRWSALLVQYWRIAVGFCHYPVEITDAAFRDLAKQLVGLLGHPVFTDTSATAIHVLCDGYYTLSQEEQQDGDDGDEDGVNVNATLEDVEDAASSAADGEALEDDLRVRGMTAAQRRRRAAARKDALEEDDAFLSMNDPGWNPHRYHNITQVYAKQVVETVFAKYSRNVMPKLCNTFETHPTTAVLLAIQSFSKVCSPAVMTSILQGIIEVGSSIVAGTDEDQSEDAVLRRAAASAAASGNAPLTSKRRMVLDIACAVVAQLPTEHLNRLFDDVIEPVLADPAPTSRLLQKKAYKLLYSLFEQRVRDVFPLFPRIAGLLSVGRQHVTISGMKLRIRCLSWALDACKMYYPDQLPATIRTMVGEIVLFSRERSGGTREMTMEVLEKMQRYLTAAGAPVNTLLHLVVAGLSGKSPMMISSAVVCMAKVVYLVHSELAESDLQSAVAVGFQLMGSEMVEVRNAAAVFARMALKLAKRSPPMLQAVEKALPKLLLAIALVTSQPQVSSSTRVQMRVLLEKCIKRFSYEKIDPVFPTGSKNFLRYTQKMMKREQKKAERDLKKRQERQQNEFDKLFLGASMNAGTDDAAEDDLLQAGALNSFVARHMAPSIPGFSSTRGGRNGEGEGEEEDEYDAMHLDFKDGKLRIISKEEKLREDDLQRRQAMADRLLRRNHGLITPATINDAEARPGKRRRDDAEDFENDELVLRYGSRVTEEAAQKAAASYAATGRTAAATVRSVGPSANQIAKLRDQKAELRDMKRQRVEEDIRKGDEYQGSGMGDVKRGNVEPFAYVPLNRRYMNRRHEHQALHRFEVVSHRHLKGEKAKEVMAAKLPKAKK